MAANWGSPQSSPSATVTYSGATLAPRLTSIIGINNSIISNIVLVVIILFLQVTVNGAAMARRPRRGPREAVVHRRSIGVPRHIKRG